MKQGVVLGYRQSGGRTVLASCLVLTCLILAGPASGAVPAPDTWLPPEILSDTPGLSTQAVVALDPATGDFVAVWTDAGMAPSEEVLGRRWDHLSRTWQAVENLSASQDWERDGGPALTCAPDGSGLLVWTRTYSTGLGAPVTGHDVLWRSWDGSAWSPAGVLLHGDSYLPGSPGAFHLILVQIENGVLLLVNWDYGHRTAWFQNGAWTEPTSWSFLDVRLAAVVADELGTLHAAAYGENSVQSGYNGWFSDAYYLTFNGAAWSEPLNLSSFDGVADTIDLTFDGAGRLHFLWSDPDSEFSDESLRSAIWERVLDGSAWTPNAEALSYNPDQAIGEFSLANGPGDLLSLAWSEGFSVGGVHSDLDIRLQIGDGESWAPEQVVATTVADSRYPMVATGADGSVVLWAEGAPPDVEILAASDIEPIAMHTTYLSLATRSPHFAPPLGPCYTTAVTMSQAKQRDCFRP